MVIDSVSTYELEIARRTSTQGVQVNYGAFDFILKNEEASVNEVTPNVESGRSINGVDGLERVSYMHFIQPDIVIEGYKIGEENGIPQYRYITTQYGKIISDGTINPETIDPRNATTEEILALNAYMLEKGTINEDLNFSAIFIDEPGVGQKFNFFEASQKYMQMQYDVGNLSAYYKYLKSLDALAEIINKIDSYKE